MNEHQQTVVSAFVLAMAACMVGIFIMYSAQRFYRQAKEAMFRLERWQRAMQDHLRWFGQADPMMLAVLENIQKFADTARPHEMSKSEAFDLYTTLWRKRANEISKIFRNLAGRELEEMTDDELKNFMLGLGIDRGPQSNEFRSALSWLVQERRDYIKQLMDANKAVDEALRGFDAKDAIILNLRHQLAEANERLNTIAGELIAMKKELG